MPWKLIEMAMSPGTRIVAKMTADRAAAEALADLGQHVGEDEHEQERLHDHADEEHPDLAAEHAEVAGEQRPADAGLDVTDRSARSFAVLPSGEVEEHGLQARHQGRRVAHRQPGSDPASMSVPSNPSRSRARTRGCARPRARPASTPRSRSAASASGAASPSKVTVNTVSAPIDRFSSAGLPSARRRP